MYLIPVGTFEPTAVKRKKPTHTRTRSNLQRSQQTGAYHLHTQIQYAIQYILYYIPLRLYVESGHL